MSLALAGFRAPGLWLAVWKLLRLRWLIFWSGFRHARLRRKIGWMVGGAALLAFLGFIFFLSWLLLRLLRSPELSRAVGDLAPFISSVPAVLLSGAFLGILLTSFGVLLQALYLAGDMDFLLATPLPIRAVFFTKLLQAILPNLGLIAAFTLPVLYGLGASAGYNLLYYPLVLFLLAALALAAAGLSSILVMFIVRIVPARRVAEVLGFLGAILSFVCSQSGQLVNLEGVGNLTQARASQFLGFVRTFNSPWSPLAWAGRGVVAVGEGRWFSGFGYSILAIGMAAGIFLVALAAAERLYFTGWAGMQAVQRKKKRNHQRTVTREQAYWLKPFLMRGRRLIPGPLRALLVKDYYVLSRDLRNLSQLVTPLIFGIIYAFIFLRQGGGVPLGRGEAPDWFVQAASGAFVYLNAGFALFVSWMLVARLAGMGFSQEGKSYWVIKSSPVSLNQLILAKFLVAYLPALLLGMFFLVAIALIQRAETGTFAFTLPVVALSIAGNTGISLAMGILGANLEWEDPRKMMKGGTGCLGSLVSFLYFPISLLLFFGPVFLVAYLGGPEWLGRLAGLMLGGAFSLVMAVLPPLLSRQRLARLGES